MALQSLQAGLLERYVVVIVQIVKAYDLIATLEQALGREIADKTGRTGDENFH